MNVEKVKFLIQSIELLIDEMKSEVYDKEFKVSETNYSEEDTEESTDSIIRQMFPISDT